MRLRIVPIVLLFMVIAVVGISNHSRKKSKLQLIDPISVSSSARGFAIPGIILREEIAVTKMQNTVTPITQALRFLEQHMFIFSDIIS